MLEITPFTPRAGFVASQLICAAAAHERATPRPSGTPTPAGDQVELSAAAAEQAAGADESDAVRIADLKARIAAGTYPTPEMLDVVVDRLHEELFGTNEPA